MKKSPKYTKNIDLLAKQSKKRREQIYEIELDAIANFKGQLQELESALGMLKIGDHFGWRVLLILHNKRTIRKYEDILNISIREFFPEEGPSAERSVGLSVAKKLGGFWKIVSGETKVEKRKEIT